MRHAEIMGAKQGLEVKGIVIHEEKAFLCITVSDLETTTNMLYKISN